MWTDTFVNQACVNVNLTQDFGGRSRGKLTLRRAFNQGRGDTLVGLTLWEGGGCWDGVRGGVGMG